VQYKLYCVNSVFFMRSNFCW